MHRMSFVVTKRTFLLHTYPESVFKKILRFSFTVIFQAMCPGQKSYALEYKAGDASSEPHLVSVLESYCSP